MKKLLLSFAISTITLSASAQALHIFHDGQTTPDVVANGAIDSIYFESKYYGSTEYQQVYVTKDGIKKYDVVDSVKFNLPHLVAFRHLYRIPSDGCGLDFIVSCPESESESPIMIFRDYSLPMDWWGHNTYISPIGGLEHRSDIPSEKFYFTCGNFIDSVSIVYTGLPLVNNDCRKFCLPPDETDYCLDVNFPKLIFESCEWVDWHYNDNGEIVLHFSKNDNERKRNYSPYVYIENDMLQVWGISIDQAAPFKHSSEEHMNALHEFCDATDFANWGKNLNWWTDEPLWKWDYGVNHRIWGDYYWRINDHITNLYFGGGQYPGVHGTLPASFEVFMDDVDDVRGALDLENCALYGEVPYNIRHHEKWPIYGWNFIMQNPMKGGGFDMEDINLRMQDEEIMYADGTKSTAYEELAKHKLTFISYGGPNEDYCNLCLSYANKGFEYIYAAQDMFGGTIEEAQKSAYEYQNVPNVKVCYKSWGNGDLGLGLGALGSTFLLDSEGNVVDYVEMIWGWNDDFYYNRLKNLLLKYLGEPEEHEPYVPNEKEYYISSDYSRDGEVLTLQTATVGKGVDLVFMGDMYVDTLLVEGGQYEDDMRASMEYFLE
jgi:hypothetical protein